MAPATITVRAASPAPPPPTPPVAANNNPHNTNRFIHVNPATGEQGSPQQPSSSSTSSSSSSSPPSPPHTNCETCHSRKLFVDNSISTTKYNLFTFLPINLFEQFQKKANLYFLLVAIISLTPLSPKTPIVSVAPLVFVLFVSALKEGIEDWGRYRMDRAVNNAQAAVWRHGQFVSIQWKDIRVGDLIQVCANHAFPADILLLQSSADQGIATIETANLDGETNLKVKQTLPELWRHEVNADDRGHVSDGVAHPGGQRWLTSIAPFIIESSPPNRKLDGNSWKGNLTFLSSSMAHTAASSSSSSSPSSDADKLSLSMSQLLLRGCVLRNTKWIIGLVIFTGTETKLMLNNKATKMKRSHVDHIVDKSLYILFAFEAFLCTFGAVANFIWSDAHLNDIYLKEDSDGLQWRSALSFLTYLVLLDILIPISLYVSMELVKFTQAYLIGRDLDMYHAETDTPAQARTSNLNEELGQVSYIFSDKTGTLTKNIMNFSSCSVGGVEYSDDVHPRSNFVVPTYANIPVRDPKFEFQDVEMIRALIEKPKEETVLIDQFLTLLCTCHSVLPSFPLCSNEHVHSYDVCKSEIDYQAASPDEKALCLAAKQNQYYYFHREPKQISIGGQIINGESILVSIMGVVHEFEILESFQFSSERARMSVILRDARDGAIKVLTKGSDTMMYRLMSALSKQQWNNGTEDHLNKFSAIGLRTLVCGFKTVKQDEFLRWYDNHKKAKASIENREELVAASQLEIEGELTLLGVTAINDALQDGVPDTIAKLAEAGIKIWVLTGDKVDTAINIARSCHLITPLMDKTGLIKLIVDDKLSDDAQLQSIIDQMSNAWATLQNYHDGDERLGLVVSGTALNHVFSIIRDSKGREISLHDLSAADQQKHNTLRLQFLNICQKCKAVVCCRVSPNQKAEIVNLVKFNIPDKITLAIGDGANDVAMIKSAHVGIGISGLEGLQATMASDYSIGQFRFLQKLLLVHGAWSYHRTSTLILYSFYKNISVAMTSFWFAIFSGWGAQIYYDPYSGAVYNIFFTSIPIMLIAVLNRPVSKENLLRYPVLYSSGPRDELFNIKKLLQIIFEGLCHSIVLFFSCYLMYGFSDPIHSHGRTYDLWVMSTSMFTYCVITVNVRVALSTLTWTWWNHLFIYGSVAIWFLFIAVYSVLWITPNMYYVADFLFSSACYWLGCIIVPAICIIPEVAIEYYRRTYKPTPQDVVQELEKGFGKHDDSIPVSSSVRTLPPNPLTISAPSSYALSKRQSSSPAHRIHPGPIVVASPGALQQEMKEKEKESASSHDHPSHHSHHHHSHQHHQQQHDGLRSPPSKNNNYVTPSVGHSQSHTHTADATPRSGGIVRRDPNDSPKR